MLEVQSEMFKGFQPHRNPHMRAAQTYDMTAEFFGTLYKNIWQCLTDDENPCTGFSLVIRPNGGFLAIIKRHKGISKEVMMAFDEDFISAMQQLEGKLGRDDFKEDTPWEPPKNKVKGKSKE